MPDLLRGYQSPVALTDRAAFADFLAQHPAAQASPAMATATLASLGMTIAAPGRCSPAVQDETVCLPREMLSNLGIPCLFPGALP